MNGNQHQKSGSRLGVVVAVAVIVSLAVSIIVGVLRQWSGFQNRAATNSVQVAVSAKDRVLKRGVIRAGYAIYPPASFKDPNTGKISGICVDVLEEAAKNLGLKVEWTEEVPWGTMIEGLQNERYDIDRKSTRLNSSHLGISYAVFCLKKKKKKK